MESKITTTKNSSLDELGQQLKDLLIKMGLNPDRLETGLVISSDRKALIERLVTEHFTAHGIQTSGGELKSYGDTHRVLFIEPPSGGVDHTTPVLSRIAAGIKKHHHGAQLAIDIGGELLSERTKGVFADDANTVIIPWSLVIRPDAIGATETFGHELIHLKQQTDDRAGITIMHLGSLSVLRELEHFRSAEIETHVFNLRHALRKLPEPHSLADFPSDKFRKLLQEVANEAIYVVESCRALETVIPHFREAISSGEDLFRIRTFIGTPISEWGIVIGRGTDYETIAAVGIRNDKPRELKENLQATIDECNHALGAQFDQCKAIHDAALSLVQVYRDEHSLLGLIKNLFRSFGQRKITDRMFNAYTALYSAASGYKPVRRVDTGTSPRSAIQGPASSAAKFEDINEWIADELQKERPALRAILSGNIFNLLSRETNQKLSKALVACPDLVNLFPRQSEEIAAHLTLDEDHVSAVQFGLFLINNLTSPSPLLYNNVAWALVESRGDSGKAVDYAKTALKLLKEPGNARYRRLREGFQDTLNHALLAANS
jgi:hypothetical protein